MAPVWSWGESATATLVMGILITRHSPPFSLTLQVTLSPSRTQRKKLPSVCQWRPRFRAEIH